jgi:hypothetical protein
MTLREKESKFVENRDTFRKSFRFRERSKKCFRPNSNESVHYLNTFLTVDFDEG